MGSAITKVRAFTLIVILSLAAVPHAAAAPRDGNVPRFERISRAVLTLMKKFTIGSNSDAVIIPRP